MVKRISALNRNYQKGVFGKKDTTGIILSEIKNLILYQVSAWPETLNEVGAKLAKSLNLKEYPLGNKAVSSSHLAILRKEPLKWWIIGSKIENFSSEESNIVDQFNFLVAWTKSQKESTQFLLNPSTSNHSLGSFI